jgi:ribonuclease HI
VDEVVRRERLLLQPGVRARRQSVLALLHPEFVEHGASGRTWDRLSIAEALSSGVAEPISMGRVEATALSEDVILLTYVARSGDSTTLRSSVWLRTEAGEWLLRFHQGTRTSG